MLATPIQIQRLYPQSRLCPICHFFRDNHVDLDTVLTVLANGYYRWLGSQLHGFDKSKSKARYRKFVETSGAMEIEEGGRIVVHFDRRAQNPVLREAQLDEGQPKIPWMANRRIQLVYA